MKKWVLPALILLLVISHFPLRAQTRENFDLQLFIESLFNTQEESLNYEDLYERLLLLYETPVNINTASIEDLRGLYILSDPQIDSLKAYIARNGKLLTEYELQLVPEFDLATIEKILPFITINAQDLTTDNRPLWQRILSERNHYFIYRYEQTLEKKRGFDPPESPTDTRYAGSRGKQYLRYRVAKPGDFSFGFTTEKDPGEAIVWDPDSKRYGMDFWSAHAMLENNNQWKKVIVGDYQLQFGQGLIFGAGFAIGKGSETINTLERVNLGIRPYTSVLEGGFLRGVAATYSLSEKVALTAFFSRLKQDAALQEDEETFEQYFSSIQTSGFHRTPSEIDNKKQITETVAGANLHFKVNGRTQLGFVISNNNFNIPIQRSNQGYNLFEFSGQSNSNGSVYANFNINKFRFFGEAGVSKSGGKGGVLGLTTTLSPRVDFALLWRNYSRDFHALRGASFAEGSRNINESGIYWGLKYTLNRSLFVTAYYDSFRFPWLRYRVNAPSEGNDYLLRVNYLPNSKVHSYIQYRKKTREENATETDTGNTIIRPGVRQQVLVNFDYRLAPGLSLKSRVQYSHFQLYTEKNDGYAFIQDAVYDFGKLILSGRIALFDTEGANNRQYAYERDVLYSFSIPAYSGEGVRNYILIQYKASRKLDLWVRWARTRYYDRKTIGNGLETIEGNQRTDVKFQIRYKLR
jgi:hypothetical protein